VNRTPLLISPLRTIMSEHSLQVYGGQARIGEIRYDTRNDHFSFEYSQDWLDRPDAYPLSPAIPLEGDVPHSHTIKRFIENLLPEGRALDIASAHYNVTKNNIFALIRQLGQETAGALSFISDEQKQTEAHTSKREVTLEELAERIEKRNDIPFMVWDGKVRMSMAGYQDKLPLYKEREKLFLVEGALSSTHILKPEPIDERLPCLVANEHFCMTLAARMGLHVAPVSILRLPAPALLVQRFDRIRNQKSVTRLHMIDACQALDFPVAYKYERNLGNGPDVRHIRDGVGFQKLFSLQQAAVSKVKTLRAMTAWAIFQFMIGNSDAHGKNFSFFCRREGLEPTPFYDLVSVVQYDHILHEMAMAYGDEFELDKITPFALADFAHQTGLDRKYLSREMRRLAKLAIAQAPLVAGEPVYQGEEQALVKRIAAFVQGQGQRLLKLGPNMLEVDETLLG
jgi:serine/threonine-protein kinase HipA